MISAFGIEHGEVSKKAKMTKEQRKVGRVMREYKGGKLHSGKGGPVVTNRKQAIAIALSEARRQANKDAQK